MAQWWEAPLAQGPVSGVVRIPGSKSLTARHLVLAALSDQPTTIRGALRSRDTTLMVAALKQLGVAVSCQGDVWTVRGGTLRSSGQIDCGLAGTVMRFVLPLAAMAQGDCILDGDEGARVRPMAGLVQALRRMGARIDSLGESDHLPLAVHGSALEGPVRVDSSSTSQFLSALLLASAAMPNPLRVEVMGKLPSLPHIRMTMQTLRAHAVPCVQDGNAFVAGGVRPAGGTVTIEPDLSNAGPFLAAAALTGGTVSIPDWPAATTQVGAHWKSILTDFGASVSQEANRLTVEGKSLRGITRDMSAEGELVPTVVALALFAEGPTHLYGIGHLRGHETDRLAALACEGCKLGAQIEEGPHFLTITPGTPRPARINTYEDHRMATFAAIAGLRTAVKVENIATTAKTLPDFARMWRGLNGLA